MKFSTPARRRSRAKKSGIKVGRKFKTTLILVLMSLLLLIFVNLFTRTKYWDGETKLHIAVQLENGDVQLLILDPMSEEITSIQIPGDTQLEVSRQLGVWKLKSVWELGKQEKVRGELLAKTLTREYRFPVYVWADSKAESLFRINYAGIAGFLLTPMDSNLTTGDKLKLALFAAGINHSKRTQIDLKNTSYIKQTKLVDGEDGFEIGSKMPRQLLALLSYPQISQKTPAFTITNKSGNSGVPGKMGEIIEVMGGKVVSIVNEPKSDFNCTISGKDEEVVKLVSLVFSCSPDANSSESNIDVQMEIGETFLKTF